MNHESLWLRILCCAVIAALTANQAWADASDENFDDQTLGLAPPCPWQDVADYPTACTFPPPLAVAPSTNVVETTDADGLPTLAMATNDQIAFCGQGIFLPVPISARYFVRADMRVDRFSDNPLSPGNDWAMLAGFGQIRPDFDLPLTAAVGVYISSFTEGWRVFAFPSSDPLNQMDFDLKLPATLGTWYTVEMEHIPTQGSAHIIIRDGASDAVLTDQTIVFEGWQATDSQFDMLYFQDGEHTFPAKGQDPVSVSNLAVVDNIHYELGFNKPCAPAKPVGDLNGDGQTDGADLGILLLNWTG